MCDDCECGPPIINQLQLMESAGWEAKEKLDNGITLTPTERTAYKYWRRMSGAVKSFHRLKERTV